MNERQARELLQDSIEDDDSLFDESVESGVAWQPDGESAVQLNGWFGIEELEAICWWVRNKGASPLND